MTYPALHTAHVQVPLRSVEMIGRWLRNWHSRQELLGLDDEQLADVGLSRDVVRAAANKPFWSA